MTDRYESYYALGLEEGCHRRKRTYGRKRRSPLARAHVDPWRGGGMEGQNPPTLPSLHRPLREV